MQYKLLQRLGAGGYGVVYLAQHETTKRMAAVKLLPVRECDPEYALRVVDEVEGHSRLVHPNIIRVDDAGILPDGRQYIAMQLVEGGDLATRQGHEYLRDTVRAVQLVAKIARAIHYAHGKGVVHRDLKPANVMLDAEWVPFVTDFGIAQLLDRGRDAIPFGTLLYASPEQCRAAVAAGLAPKHTTDVYALGAILYELLTSERPYQAAQTVEQRREAFDAGILPAAPSRQHPRYTLGRAPDLELDQIVANALALHPHARYPSAKAFAEDLDRWVLRMPASGREMLQPRALRKWRHFIARNRAVLCLALVPLMLCLALSVFIASTAISQNRTNTQHTNQVVAELTWQLLAASISDLKHWVAEFAAHEPFLKARLQQDRSAPLEGQRDAVWSKLTSGALKKSGADQFYLLDRHGCIVEYWPAPAPGQVFINWYGFRDYFACAFAIAQHHIPDDACLSRVYRSEYDIHTDTLRMAISAPVYAENNQWIGVFVASWRADQGLGPVRFGSIPVSRSTTSLLAPRDLERYEANPQLTRLRTPVCTLDAAEQSPDTAGAHAFVPALTRADRRLSLPRNGLGDQSLLDDTTQRAVDRSLAAGQAFEHFRDPRDGFDYLAAFAGGSGAHDAKRRYYASHDALPIVVAATHRDVLRAYEVITIACCVALWLVSCALFCGFVYMLLRQDDDRLRYLMGDRG